MHRQQLNRQTGRFTASSLPVHLSNFFSNFFQSQKLSKSHFKLKIIISALVTAYSSLILSDPALAQRSRYNNRSNYHEYSPSADYCNRVARNYADNSVGGGALDGAATGIVAGGIFSLLTGGYGEEALIGGAMGAIAGGATEAEDRNRAYRRAFNECMRGNRY